MTVTRTTSSRIQSSHQSSSRRNRSPSSKARHYFAQTEFRVVVLVTILLLLQLTTSTYGQHFTLAANPADEDDRPPCDIRCKNGGTCYYISDDFAQLEHESQAGRPIQRCACPAGFGGVACEIPTEECNMETLTCAVSKKPCEPIPGTNPNDDNLNNRYTCACHVADSVGDDSFAGRVCRKGYTEYCSSRYDPNAEKLFFCTNGGKCIADFLAARVAPGNTTVNREYEDAGCRCNTNFYGPHCEFLKFDQSHITTTKKEKNEDGSGGSDRDGSGGQIDTSSSGNHDVSSGGSGGDNVASASSAEDTTRDTVDSAEHRNKSSALFVIVAFLGVVLLLSAYLVIRRHHLLRRRRRRRALDQSSTSPELNGARVMKVDGFFDFAEQDPAEHGGDNQNLQTGMHDDDDEYHDDMDHQDVNPDYTTSAVTTRVVAVDDTSGYNDLLDNDDKNSGQVQHVQESNQEYEEEEEYEEGDDDEEDSDEFFDDLVHAEQELVNTNKAVAAIEPDDIINSDQTTVISAESDDIINSDQTTVISAESDDLVSKCHTEITVPASNTTSSRVETNRGGGALSYPKSASRELLSKSSEEEENDVHFI